MRALIALSLLLLCMAPAHAQARKNKIWVGNLERLEVKEPVNQDPYIEVEIVEDRADGKFGPYDIQKTLSWTALEKPKVGVELTLDGIWPERFLAFNYAGSGALLKRVTVDSTTRSTQQPDVLRTVTGRQIEHSKIIIESSRPVLVNTTVVTNLGDEKITLRFTVVDRPESSQADGLSNALEFSTQNFDRPSTAPLISAFTQRQQDYIRRVLSAVRMRHPDDYVTAIYPVQYANPELLANLTRGRLSQLGRIDVDRERSSIIVTDRVRYVRNLMESLITLDRRPPQVTVVAQIVEVNRSTGTKLGVDFSYLGNRSGSGLGGASFNSSGFLGQAAILSGVYQNFSSNALKQFAADINLLIERRHAKLAAQPVLRVVNNSRGVFNSGERLPFYLPRSQTDLQTRTRRRNESVVQRFPGEDIINTSTPREERAGSDGQDYQESRVNSGLTTVRTGVRLTITPALRNSDEALLSINAGYNELTGYSQPHGDPIVAERSVDTRIRVRHGETVVLAGLYRESEITQSAGIPFLSDIPVIGRLFESERKSKETYDIIFILTTFIQHD